MRRLLFSLLATTFVGTLAGCHATHGVCDCAWDFDNRCAYRAPWLVGPPPGPAIGPAVGPAVAPTPGPEKVPLPEIREALPTAPKKL